MSLQVWNTLSRKLELFEPIHNLDVGLYTCGPTVYNYPHIGNYRAYIFADILKRYLVYRGYNVKHIMNITDVDDKTIRDSQKGNKTLKEFTEFYTESFMEDIEKLNIVKAYQYTKATDYIKEMLELIEILLKKGFAYKSEDGSIYFNVLKDPSYGKLSHFKIDELKKNALGRLIDDEYEKDNVQDFALWKSWSEEDKDVFWIPEEVLKKETIIGKGRPGWHIECSAMSMSLLGESFDIHTGGVDNMFPHHENEIAQSESATDKPFSKYFMHNEFLLVNNKKMSKSLGNSYTLNDLIKKGINPIAFRLWVQTSHYRTQANFTIDTVLGSMVALNRIREHYLKLGEEIGEVDKKYRDLFIETMDKDLDTPKALAILWDLLKNKDIEDKNKKATLLDFDKVFGFGLNKYKKEKTIDIPKEIQAKIKERDLSRENKDWQKSDELREEIEKMGYTIKDSPEGGIVSKN